MGKMGWGVLCPIFRPYIPQLGRNEQHLARRDLSFHALKTLFCCLLAAMVSGKNLVVTWVIACVYKRCCFSLAAFQMFPSVFSNVMMTCLGLVSFPFILFGVHWASWMLTFMYFTKFGMFQPIFLQIIFCPNLLLAFWNQVCAGPFHTTPAGPWCFVLVFSLYLCSSEWIFSIYLSSCSLAFLCLHSAIESISTILTADTLFF